MISQYDKHGLKPVGGKTQIETYHLQKKDATGTLGEVDAEDQQHDSMYLCAVQIGYPAQTFNHDFDTGSSDLWVCSTELSKIKFHPSAVSHNMFDANKSETFAPLKECKWNIKYGDSSTASGIVGTDDVTIGGLTVRNQAIELANNLSTEFQLSAGDGLVGLAWGTINTVQPKRVHTLVENMITQNNIPQSAQLFTAYLSSWRDATEANKCKSFYTFGYIVKNVPDTEGADIFYTDVDNTNGLWQFPSTSATVNGQVITRKGNKAIADTGTTLCLVHDNTCKAIYKAIPGAKYDRFQQGYTFPVTSMENLPTVTFAIGDVQFTVHKKDLAFANVDDKTMYGGIQSRGNMTFDIFGGTVLKGIYAIFDVGNRRFGAMQRAEKGQKLVSPEKRV